MNRITREKELIINKNKSGIMYLNEEQTNRQQILGVPCVNQYKYLGTWLDQNLDPMTHLKALENKMSILSRKFYALRKQGNIKFNINIFKIFILPNIKMLATLYNETNPRNKGKILVILRRKIRDFCLLPRNSPN